MNVVIGIDPDWYRLAYAVLLDRHVRAVVTIPRLAKVEIHPQYDARLAALMRYAVGRNARVYLEAIYLAERVEAEEGQAPGRSTRNVQTFQRLAEVQGEILAAARRSNVTVCRVMPRAWQCAVLGKVRGREAIKEASVETAQARWGRPLSSHEADAVCIALFGAHGGRRIAV